MTPLLAPTAAPSADGVERTASKRPERTWGVALPPSLREALSRSHTPGLDGLRMVAAFLVVFYHFGIPGVPGAHGVLAFFVLSGFLITWLLLRERERFGGISLRLFYLRRLLRIVPAFLCFWLLWTGILLVSGKPILWGQALSALVYLGDYYNAIFGDPNTGYSHTWSLGIEEQFYLFWPLALIALHRRARRPAVIVAAAIGLVWAHRAVLQFVVGVDQRYLYAAFDTRADQLLVGCLLAVLLHESSLPWLWRRLCTTWMSLVALALLATSVWLSAAGGVVYRDVVGFAIDPVLVAVLLTQAMALNRSWLWRWLNWSWVRYLGVLSYSIYLYQQVVIDPVKRALAPAPLLVQLVVTLGALILVAGASYHVVERPFLRLKEAIASRKGSRMGPGRRTAESVRVEDWMASRTAFPQPAASSRALPADVVNYPRNR